MVNVYIWMVLVVLSPCTYIYTSSRIVTAGACVSPRSVPLLSHIYNSVEYHACSHPPGLLDPPLLGKLEEKGALTVVYLEVRSRMDDNANLKRILVFKYYNQMFNLK